MSPTSQKYLLVLILFTSIINFSSSISRGSLNQSNVINDFIHNRDLINDYIQSLTYDRDTVLAYKGRTFEVIMNKGYLDRSKNFVTITQVSRSFGAEQHDIGVIASNEHITFPGALLSANDRLLNNAPDFLAFERQPLRYSINLPGLTSDSSFTIVPSFAEYQSSMSKILNTWYHKQPHHVLNANFHSEYGMAYSQDQLRVMFGVEFNYFGHKLNIDFNAVTNKDKLIMIRRFRQIFYTVSVEAPQEPSDLFGSRVTLDKVRRRITNENPAVMVNSVSYGRQIYVKIETSSTDAEARFILENKLTFGNSSLNIDHGEDYIKHLDNLNMLVYVLGGSSQQLELMKARTESEVNEIISQYGTFDINNPGFPVSYSTMFIKDNSRGMIMDSANYTEPRRLEFESGVMEIINYSGFRTHWSIVWDEVNYASNGTLVRVSRTKNLYLKNGGSQNVQMAGNCRNIAVSGKVLMRKWFIPFMPKKWRTIIDVHDVPLIDYRTFTIFRKAFPMLPTPWSIIPPL